MEATKLLVLTVVLTVLLPWVSNLEQLKCDKGSLDISIKNSPKPIMKINCNLKAVVIIVKEKSEEECLGDSASKIVSRSEWGAAAERSPSEILPATDCVIVDGSTYNTKITDYKEKLKKVQEQQINDFGSFLNNFHIADDGVVYEALGWGKFYFYRSGGLKCLRIGFIKNRSYVPPSTIAVNAFNELLNTAICLGKLSPSYRIIPYHFISDFYNLVPTSFERNALLKWNKCEKDPDLTKENYDYGSFPIIFKEDWGGGDAIGTVYNRTNKIKFVMVSSYDVRCFNTENCIQYLKWEVQQYGIREFKGNYMIGDDGFAYELFHWNQSWDEYWINKDAIFVRFLGNFQSYLPSERAMKAFSRLLRIGVLWGYLSPDYKIVSHKHISTDTDYPGVLLDDTVRKMERFSPEF